MYAAKAVANNEVAKDEIVKIRKNFFIFLYVSKARASAVKIYFLQIVFPNYNKV